MVRTRSNLRGSARGRGNGRSEPRPEAQPSRRRSRNSAPGNENPPPFVLDPSAREAIAHEIHSTIQDTIPDVIAETIRSMARENQNEDSDSDPDLRDNRDEDRVRNLSRGCDYGSFKRCSPPSFDGCKDAAAAHQWIREMEAVLNISECRENQKVKFATHSFISEALCWWDNLVQAMGRRSIQQMKWNELKNLVINQFCPTNEIDKIERDFMRLEAGSMTHRQYTTKFNEMARLVPGLVATEARKIKRYVQGLPVDIRKFVIASQPSTFQKTVEISGILYDERIVDCPSEQERNKDNRNNNNNSSEKYQGGSSRSRKKRANEEDPRQDGEHVNSSDDCRKCGKRHSGECRFGDGVCYVCGLMGHYSFECPRIKCHKCGENGHKASRCSNG